MVLELPEGTVTVLFTDVVGSTALTNRLGDEAARKVLGACDELVREQLVRHRGREVKGTGDGLMLAFTSARRAVACAIDVQRAIAEQSRRDADRAVAVRIGLNTGEVVREEEDLFGATVNAAARIASEGNAGDILISESVKIVLGTATTVELRSHGKAELKGFAEPWQLYAVNWEEAASPALHAGTSRTPYVGREEERAQLRQLLEGAAQGSGSLVMIGGEPGVGKTRISEELLAEAGEKGYLTLVGHCYEMEGAPPYIPFVEIMQAAMRAVTPETLRAALGDEAPEVAKVVPELRRLFPDIPPPLELPPEQERHYLFNSLRAFMARTSAAQPIVLLLDDLHWADESTLLLVQHYAQQLSSMSVLIVGTYRDVELEIGRPLARALEDLLRQRLAHRISLRRLPLEDVAGMLRAASGQEPPQALVEVVFSETEGNPFFVEEVFQHFREEGKLFDEQGHWRADLVVTDLDVPEGVRLVIGRRLQHVGDRTRHALTNAAVIGRVFDFDLLEAMDSDSPEDLLDAIDEAEEAHLITAVDAAGREARFMFSHELIRQTLISSLSLPRRQRLHLRIAEAIEAVHRGDVEEHAADLAHHLYQAGAAADTEKTCRFLTLAGNRALSAAAFEEAARHFDAALAIVSAEDIKARADLLYAHGLAIRSVGRWEDALNAWRTALPMYEELGDIGGGTELCQRMTEQLGWNALWEEASEVADHGLALAGNEPTSARGRLLVHSGLATALGRSYAEGMTYLDEAEEISRNLNDDWLLGRVIGTKSNVEGWYMQTHKAIDGGSRAVELLRSRHDLWQLVDTLFGACYAYNSAGQLDRAQQLAKEAMAIAETIGHLGGMMAAKRGYEIAALMKSGDIAAFEAYARDDLELGQQADMPWVSNAHTYLGLVHFWRGNWDDAARQLDRAVELEPQGMLDGWDSMHAIIAKTYTGDHDGARALLERKRHLMARPGEPNNVGAWAILAAAIEMHGLLGDSYDSEGYFELVLEALTTGSLIIFPTTHLQMLAGICATDLQRWEDAEEHFEASIKQASEIPSVIALPDIRRWYARMLLSRANPGDNDKARQLVAAAVAGYREIGMPKHIEIAEALLLEV